MSEDSKRSKKTSDLAHNIWLAGLGAYGRAWDGTKDTIKRVEKGSSAIFDELVSKGEDLEKEAQQTVTKVAKSAENFSIEERINRVRDSFSLSPINRSDKKLEVVLSELKALRNDVKSLTEEVRILKSGDDK